MQSADICVESDRAQHFDGLSRNLCKCERGSQQSLHTNSKALRTISIAHFVIFSAEQFSFMS